MDKIVGHLPREISRVTKFFLDPGTVSRIDFEALSPLTSSLRWNENRLFSNREDAYYFNKH